MYPETSPNTPISPVRGPGVPVGTVETPTQSTIVVSGADKQLVGEFAAEVRHARPPEPYGGKGIKYDDEVVKRKAGKALTGGAA